MDLKQALIIVISGFFGACGFALLFRVRRERIFWATVGGGLVCIVYVVCVKYFDHEFFQNLFPALAGAVYSEIMARLTKSPTTTFLASAIIPLVPGGKLYYTMYYFIVSDKPAFSQALTETARIAAGLAVGVILVSILVHIINHRRFKQIYDID